MTSSRPEKPPTARDGDLWDALRRQEPEALGELFSRYAAAVHAYAVRHTGSYAYADDAVQAAFVTAWKHFGRSELAAWRPVRPPSLMVSPGRCRSWRGCRTGCGSGGSCRPSAWTGGCR
ncbi:RNA polymerase sigma factor [Kribbella sp. CA-245084]|uniref:RNA polymerase sigma factor n=1 Tax=Kribbella sp. CA-245084 TaxID=3239940 RepID=UPI003D9282EF